MAVVPASPRYHLLQQLQHRPSLSQPPFSSSILIPLLVFNINSKPLSKCFIISHPCRSNPSFFSYRPLLPCSSFFFCHSLALRQHSPSTSASNQSLSSAFEEGKYDEEEAQRLEDEDGLDSHEKVETEIKSESLDFEESSDVGLDSLRTKTIGLELPSLTVKEKKELASHAHSLGKKLKSQLVGKSGVTANVAASFIENLESNELLKIKIHRTCPGELDDVVKLLEKATGSVVIDQIGRTTILYRPSLTKLKAEEKRKKVLEAFKRRKQKMKQAVLSVKNCRPMEVEQQHMAEVGGEAAGFKLLEMVILF